MVDVECVCMLMVLVSRPSGQDAVGCEEAIFVDGCKESCQILIEQNVVVGIVLFVTFPQKCSCLCQLGDTISLMECIGTGLLCHL